MFFHQSVSRRPQNWVHYGPVQNMVSMGTSPDTQRLRTVGKMRCLHSCTLHRELCSSYACLLRVCNQLLGLTCTWTHSALWDKWNEVNHLGDCSPAIDFMGHQIILGLAEHMPFSTEQRLSFSRINSSNYPAPPTTINSGPIILSSRNWNGEVDYSYCWCNHTKVKVLLTEFFKYWLFQFNISTEW